MTEIKIWNKTFYVDDELAKQYEELHRFSFASLYQRALFVMFDKWEGKNYFRPTDEEFAEFFSKHSDEEVQKALDQYLADDVELYTDLLLYGD